MTTSAVPIVNLGLSYANNMQVSRASNTTLTIATGQVRDSTNVFDIVLASTLTLNAAVNGVNGLDTGTFAASKMYYVYAVMDPTNKIATGTVLSLSVSGPTTIPSGYSAYRLLAAWPSDASTHFLAGQYSGNSGGKVFYYDTPLATAVTAGNGTTFAAVNLLNLVPAIDATQVDFYMAFTPGAASRTASFRPTGSSSTNGEHVITGQVSAVVVDQKVRLITNLATGNPELDWKVSNAGDALAISIEGFILNT